MHRTNRATIAIRSAALLAAMSILLAACGGSGSGAPGDSSAPKMANFAFAPASVTVKAGSSLTWTNTDSVGHTVTADDGSFDSGTVAGGTTFSHTFATAGTFTYHCSIHSSMHGTVTVTP